MLLKRSDYELRIICMLNIILHKCNTKNLDLSVYTQKICNCNRIQLYHRFHEYIFGIYQRHSNVFQLTNRASLSEKSRSQNVPMYKCHKQEHHRPTIVSKKRVASDKERKHLTLIHKNNSPNKTRFLDLNQRHSNMVVW